MKSMKSYSSNQLTLRTGWFTPIFFVTSLHASISTGRNRLLQCSAIWLTIGHKWSNRSSENTNCFTPLHIVNHGASKELLFWPKTRFLNQRNWLNLRKQVKHCVAIMIISLPAMLYEVCKGLKNMLNTMREINCLENAMVAGLGNKETSWDYIENIHNDELAWSG